MSVNPSSQRDVPEFRSKVCGICGKPRETRKGSITSWLFTSNVCRCRGAAAESDETGAIDSTRSGAFKTLSVKLSNTRDRIISEPNPASGSALPELGDKVKQNYDIISRLGEGGMGQVYLVKERITGKLFALKLIRQELMSDPRTIKQFDREATAVSKLIHPNLVGVVDHAAPLNGAPYLIMEYVEGTSLASLLQKYQRLDPSEVLQIFLQVCSAIEHAHTRGVLHCDIKPSNIIINEDSDNYVKVIDFGIAKLIKGQQLMSQDSHAGELVGTPEYMSPEHCQSEPLDARSDIYSIGCVMYEALCGKPPFTNRNTIKLILDQVNTTPLPLNKAYPDLGIPSSLAAVVHKCLKKRPEDRYQKASELKDSLQKLAAGDPVKHAVTMSVAVKVITAVATLSICLWLAYFVIYVRFAPHQSQNPYKADTFDAPAPIPVTPTAILPTQPATSTSTTANSAASIKSGEAKVGAGSITDDGNTSYFTTPVDMQKECANKNRTSLDLSFGMVRAQDLGQIGSLKKLRILRLTGTSVDDSIFPIITKLPDLEELAIGSTDVTPQGLAMLAKMPKLKRLDLAGSNIMHASMNAIANLQNLRSLDVNYSDFSDKDAAKLLNLKHLSRLLVSCIGVGDSGVAQLCKLPLELLNISHSRITDAALKDVAKIPTLTILNASRTRVTDKAVKFLVDTKIQSLDFKITSITPESAASFAKINSLREVFVDQPIAMSPQFLDMRKQRAECFINVYNPLVKDDKGAPTHTQITPAANTQLQQVPMQVEHQ